MPQSTILPSKNWYTTCLTAVDHTTHIQKIYEADSAQAVSWGRGRSDPCASMSIQKLSDTPAVPASYVSPDKRLMWQVNPQAVAVADLLTSTNLDIIQNAILLFTIAAIGNRGSYSGFHIGVCYHFSSDTASCLKHSTTALVLLLGT